MTRDEAEKLHFKEWINKQKFKLHFYKYEILFVFVLLCVAVGAISLIYFASSRLNG